jgi:O-antigen ligase
MRLSVCRFTSILVQFGSSKVVRTLKTFCSYYGLFLCLLTLSIVLISYAYGLLQPVRWPSLIYFLISFSLTLVSVRWSTAVLVFSLPLLPCLHTQLSYIKSPPVPYFVNYAGIDAIVGYAVGLLLLNIANKTNNWKSLLLPPWTAGLVLIVTSASAAVAVCRNLWQSTSEFSFVGLVNSLLRFKLVTKLNDYFPVVDLLVYTSATLLFTLLIYFFKENRDSIKIVFRSLMCAAVLAALLGIIQAITAFGLAEHTIEYRSIGIGYGAIGFQPDIHAYGAHMLVGTVGLLGYLSVTSISFERKVIFSVMSICCVALVLSKSRTSAIFLVIVMAIYFLNALNDIYFKKNRFIFLTLFLIVTIIISIVQSFAFNREIVAALSNSSTSFWQKMNEISRYRLEIFVISLRFFSLVPLFGIGHGNFFRISRNQELTGVNWFSSQGGENAHNYFLQSLVELGLVGLVIYGIFFLYPIVFRSKYSRVMPAMWALLAVALGNVYSHSLIIRENLFLLAVFTALLYANARVQYRVVKDDVVLGVRNAKSLPKYLSLFAILCVCGLLLLIAREVRQSFNKAPFAFGDECLRVKQALGVDGWSSGTYRIALPTGVRDVSFFVDDFNDEWLHKVTDMHLVIYDQLGVRIIEKTYTVNRLYLPLELNISVPQGVSSDGQLVATLSYPLCFTPANHSLSSDDRRLAFKVRHAFVR